MNLQIKIEEESFKVSVGKGYNDWVWLSHYASRAYSKSIYPQGTYIPTHLYLEHNQKQIEYFPHPREKIFKYLEHSELDPSEVTCIVKIRKANHSYSEVQKKWEKQAFEVDQYFLTFSFNYLASAINRKKEFYLKVKTTYQMAEQVSHRFSAKQYPAEIQTLLNEKQINQTSSKFDATLRVPLGKTEHRLFYYDRESPSEDFNETELTEKKLKGDFLVRQEPIYVPLKETLQCVSSDMVIEESINKTLQQKQLQTKKRNASSSLCCYTFQQLWGVISKKYSEDLSLEDYEPSTIERIKLSIEKSLNELYEIFFYYFILENQQKDKKEELGIIYQDVMHFLKDYEIFTNMTDLVNFLEFYNADDKFNGIKDTLNIATHGIQFPQFVAILLRSIQFVQTSTFLMKGETFDTAAHKIIGRIQEINEDSSEFTEFRRNLRQNPKIISFSRTYSQKLKEIFVWMHRNSVQKSAEGSYVIQKEEVKYLLSNFNLTEGNVDKIVNECFKALKLPQNEDGIFYYDFLIVMEWLSMAIVADEKDEEPENEDEEALMIVEKMKYVIEKINTED